MTGETVIVGRTTYEVVGHGCDWNRCTNERPLTVYELNARGGRRYGSTMCVEAPE
jgi:hypothetical protein